MRLSSQFTVHISPRERTVSREPRTKNQLAFTLIELLVVIVVLGILGVVGTDLFSSVIKGTNKANAIAELKQNGQLAMDIIERNIREAANAENPIVGSQADTGILILTMPSGVITRFEFVAPCGNCTPKTNGQITMNNEPITSTNAITGVNVVSASFNINPPPPSNPTSPKTVTVTFQLEQGISAPTRKDFTASVPFASTVSLRSY